ncbi:MAG: amidohydrolase [Euryarchaeota archaeon]|nr:amidohydrolase [Euryarchaeota archaeon]
MARGLAVVNAQIWTMETRGDRADSMLVQGERVSMVGEERTILAKARTSGLPVADASGRTILPGLVDAHTHLVHQGLLQHRLDLRDAPSLSAALRAVRRRLARHRGRGLVLAERWDESRWPERRYPRREELDAITTKVPLILRRVDGHVAVGNRAACDFLRGRLPGVDADTGLLLEEASLNLNQVFPTPLPEATSSLAFAQEQALTLGVTTVHDFVVPSYLRAFEALHRRGRLKVRAHVSLYVEFLDALAHAGVAGGIGDDRLRLHGVKLFGDGSLGGHTAALRQPYADAPGTRGRLNFTDSALRERIRTASTAGLVPSVHAIGDAAVAQAVKALAASGDRRLRPRIEHFEMHAPESVRTVAERGIVASMQPNFVGEWNRPGGLYEQRLASPRYRRTNEFQALRRAGVRLAFGSDCMPFDPWFGLAGCVEAPQPSQRLSVDDALEAYTRGSAWSIGREADLGWLGRGSAADFMVLPTPPRRGTGLAGLRPDATYVAGAAVHARAGRALRSR